MMQSRRQRGAALMTAIFLITVLAVLAAAVAMTAGQQQTSSAQALDQTRAYYAARGRLDIAIERVLNGSGCGDGTGTVDLAGFTTEIDSGDCAAVTGVREGGDQYDVYTITARAHRGDQASGTRVQREVRVQITKP